MFIEIIPEITKNGDIVAITFILPTSKEITFEPYRELVNGQEILTVKKVNDYFLPDDNSDDNLFKKLRKKALELLINNPPDFSWLKCAYCNLISEEVIILIKAGRLKEVAGHLVIKCSYCGRYYKIPYPPASFLKCNIL